jgi:enamine deaminase RidA (YjgF/YER057c/UK114 family)
MPSCEEAVEHLTIDCGRLPAIARVARFKGAGGVAESHITIHLRPNEVMDPLDVLVMAYRRAMESCALGADSAILRRLFCSDVCNQAEMLERVFDNLGGPCALSIIGQPPLPSTKFALWAYHVSDPHNPLRKSLTNQTLVLSRGSLTHYWTSGLTDTHPPDSLSQTRNILESYDALLASNNLRTADHVLRTWWFVQNIDADYPGLVDARNAFFSNHGLTADTHFIASTGIAGSHAYPSARVALDSHAIGGLLPGQVRYLQAPDHLCPTLDYGVAFERATAVDYADRSHVFISGTASIDHTGSILHQGDVLAQLDRTLQNIEALLAQAAANSGDLAMIIVYLRDPADAALIGNALHDRLGKVPRVIVHAPVCRPGWLIEIEGIAVLTRPASGLPPF